jgi:hypothetical protein
MFIVRQLKLILVSFFQGDDGKIDQDITGNGEMYEIENEDHIAIDRNDGNTEYAGEGYGKFMYIINYGKVPLYLSLCCIACMVFP